MTEDATSREGESPRSGSTSSLEQVREALAAVVTAGGEDAAFRMLAGFHARCASELLPDHYGAAMERVLESVRAGIAGGRTITEAIAPWLARVAPELLFGVRYDAWVDRQWVRVAAEELAESYVTELARYGRACIGPLRGLPVCEVQYPQLEDLDTVLSRQGLKAATRAHVFDALRGCLRWLKRRREIASVPEIPRITVPEHAPALLDPEQQRRVIDAIPEARRGIFLALAFHGLRPSEAARLDVSDYDWRSGQLRPWKTKTKRSRVIPASDELRAWIDARVDRAGRLTGAALFQNPRGRTAAKRWTLDALEDTWAVAVKAAGVPTVGSTRGRSTRAPPRLAGPASRSRRFRTRWATRTGAAPSTMPAPQSSRPWACSSSLSLACPSRRRARSRPSRNGRLRAPSAYPGFFDSRPLPPPREKAAAVRDEVAARATAC